MTDESYAAYLVSSCRAWDDIPDNTCNLPPSTIATSVPDFPGFPNNKIRVAFCSHHSAELKHGPSADQWTYDEVHS